MLEVLDTAGQEEYTSLRDQWIRDGEGFVLVYSIASAVSFNAIEKFYNLIQRVKEPTDMHSGGGYSGHQTANAGYMGKAPVMLVANKCDMTTAREVTTQMGIALARKLKCDFIEASAKNCVNVERAFYDVVRQLRRQKSAAQRPRAEKRSTQGRDSGRRKEERYDDRRGVGGRDGSGGGRKRRNDGGSRCVIL
jgi:GTPase KRas protein